MNVVLLEPVVNDAGFARITRCAEGTKGNQRGRIQFDLYWEGVRGTWAAAERSVN